MAWSLDQLLGHPKRKSLLSVNTKLQSATTKKVDKISAQAATIPDADIPADGQVTFTAPGQPFGKPRMTQRDVWQKRPCVLVYRDYCDRLRAAAPAYLGQVDCYAILVCAFLSVPPSWSAKKKAAALGQGHRVKPDHDNILKAVNDALFKQDSKLWDGHCIKRWCAEGQERTEVTLRFDRKTSSI